MIERIAARRTARLALASAMTAATAGNGLSLVRNYDERGLPANIGVHPPLGGPTLLDRDYAVDATGNIEAIDDFVQPLSSEGAGHVA